MVHFSSDDLKNNKDFLYSFYSEGKEQVAELRQQKRNGRVTCSLE